MQFLKKLWKMSENIEICYDILVITERRRNYLMPEPNDYATRFFTENLLAIEMYKN